MHGKKLAMRYFMLSFAVGFLVLSVTAMLVVLYIPPRMSKGAQQQTAGAENAYFPDNADALNLLLVVDSGEADSLFIVVRFDPMRGQVPVAVLPAGTLVRVDGDDTTISSVYAYAGARAVASRIVEDLGIAVDRYMKLGQENVVELVDLLGGVKYRLEQDLRISAGGVESKLPAGVHQLSGGAVYGIVTNGGFKGGEKTRCAVAGEVLAALINQHAKIILTEEADSIFQQIVNHTQTDLSAVDYQQRKPAMRFVARLAGEPAYLMELTGEAEGRFNTYTLSQTSRGQLAATFGPPGRQGGDGQPLVSE